MIGNTLAGSSFAGEDANKSTGLFDGERDGGVGLLDGVLVVGFLLGFLEGFLVGVLVVGE